MGQSSRTPYVVLGILGVLEPKALSGYDIKQLIDGTISHFWAESYGQIYPVLKQLAADKLIRARAGKEGGRKRIVYSITALGKKRLRSWMEKPPEPSPHREELILKLFFGSMTNPSVLIGHLSAHRDRVNVMVQQYSGGLKHAQGQHERYTAFQVITLRGGIAMCNTFVQWADESLATLKKMKGGK